MAAIGTLKGPLHGGANEQVMRMLLEIELARSARGLARGRRSPPASKIMGFGHRVYKEGDPRAKILRAMSRELTREIGHPELYEMSARLEELMQVSARG